MRSVSNKPCVKSIPECKITQCISNSTLCLELHNFCKHNEYLNSFCKTTHFVSFHKQFVSRIHWKILHLTEFFTQPAVVMVVTNIRYGSASCIGAGSTFSPSTLFILFTSCLHIHLGNIAHSISAVVWMMTLLTILNCAGTDDDISGIPPCLHSHSIYYLHHTSQNPSSAS